VTRRQVVIVAALCLISPALGMLVGAGIFYRYARRS
jgi:hypothetical protein